MKLQGYQSSATPLSYFDGQKMGGPLALFIALVTLGIFFEQFDLANFGYTAPAITKSWGLSMGWVGRTNAMGSFGMLAGALMGGWFADKAGRKIGFIASTIFYGVCTILCGLAPTPSWFMVCRFVTMMGASALSVTAMVFIAEMVPAEKRGKLGLRAVGIAMVAMPLAGLFAKWVVTFGPEGWRLQYYWGGAFALVEVVLVSFLCYESPRWLVSVGRGSKAKAIMERMLPGVAFDASAFAAPRRDERKGASFLATLKAFKTMWNSFYLRRSILLILMAIVASNTAATISLMLPTLFKARGLSLTNSILLVSIMSWGAPAGTILASFGLDKGGRKVPLALYGTLAAILIAVLGFAQGFTQMAYVGLALQLVNPMYYFSSQVYTTESFGTSIRSTATGVIIGVGRLSTAIWMLCIASLYMALGFSGFLSMTGGCIVLVMIGVLVFGHSTSKRSLEEISGEA